MSIDLNNLNDEITSILDEHDLSQALQDSLHEDIAELIWSVVNASGNYVADHDTYPKEVHFSNGRIVRISANGPHLVIDQVADSSYVTALSLEQGETKR